jgi:RNA polymerase sigma-B factor
MSGSAPGRTGPGPPDPRYDDEHALFERFARDRDQATRDVLVECYLPLARKLAATFRHGEDSDDLEQVAAIGLVKAVDRFELERGLAFSTYAMPTILGELKRHFRDQSWTVRVPRSVKELAVRLERVSIELVSELGRSPTVPELARATNSTGERVLDALEATGARHLSSLDGPDTSTEESDRGREVPVEDPGFSAVEDAATLDTLLRVLHPRDRLIVELRFREDQLQWQIAEVVGVTQMHVSRVIRRSINQLALAAIAQPDEGSPHSPLGELQ